MILFQAKTIHDRSICDNKVSGNREGAVGLTIGGKTRSWIQPYDSTLFTSGPDYIDSYEYCIPFSKMQTNDKKLETLNFIPDRDGVSSSFK